METRVLGCTLCQIGVKQLCDKHMRYPENTGLEDFMISGSRITWSYLNILLHWRVHVDFAQQLIIIAARKHIVFKLRDVLHLSSKYVHKIWVSFAAFLSLSFVKLCTDWNLHCIEMKYLHSWSVSIYNLRSGEKKHYLVSPKVCIMYRQLVN